MLYILRESTPGSAPPCQPILQSRKPQGKFEAIKCLLTLGDRYGIEAVKEYLSSDVRELVEQAITLAGAFRIKEAVPDLLQMLRKRGIGGADLYDKIPLVKALGDIGDPRSLDMLRELLSARASFSKGLQRGSRKRYTGH